MSHERSRPGKEKRKPKKEKVAIKPVRDVEVLQHVQQHNPEDGR